MSEYEHPLGEHFVRAKLIQSRMDRVHDAAKEAAREGDLDRLDALNREAELLLNSLRDVHEEQLISMLPKPKLPKKRRWWAPWRREK